MTKVHRSGELAYFDSLFCGLVPCKVLEVISDTDPLGITKYYCKVKITADRGTWKETYVTVYKRGDTETFYADRVVPREHVYTRSGLHFIRSGWTWKEEE